ncbi:SMI1/KNR4 family protein [Pendulispora brunnea]|uniref:SMI1/KNR4 family protein n=1 Tax=Pendulispora brunnea TaxID=2905690 RepID=A0ABZ2KN20_9BACT
MSDEAERVCTLWTAVTGDGHSAIAKAGWRSWPPGVNLHATKRREDAVAAAMAYGQEFGVGYVVRFDLKIDPDERALDALDIDSLSRDRALATAIMEETKYRGRVEDDEIARAEAAMGRRFPAAWRAYIQSPVWFCKGWLPRGSFDGGAFVWLYTPAESADIVLVWKDLEIAPPGMVVIGGDGASEHLTLDERDPRTSVTLTNNVEVSWEDSIVQCRSIEAFIRSIQDDTFRFVFGTEKEMSSGP